MYKRQPLAFTFAGLWEIDPQWLEEHLAEVRVLDVREPEEFDGPLGHLPGAQPVPLGELAQRVAEIPPDLPVVTVCRAGARSAQAAVLLRRAGFERVANLGGGMLRWRADSHPVEGGVGG